MRHAYNLMIIAGSCDTTVDTILALMLALAIGWYQIKYNEQRNKNQVQWAS